jgi:hypothetical protein
MNTTLINSVPIKIRYANGQEEAITIRQLTIRELYQFIDHIAAGATPAIVGLCANRNGEWIDSLDLDSYGALAEECICINFPKAAQIATHDPLTATKMAPLFSQMGRALALTGKALTETPKSPAEPANSGTNGADSSPAPASSASAEEAGKSASI